VELTTLGLRACLVAGFDIMGVESSGFAARMLVTIGVDT
jgi:hypothetical protein